MRQLNIQEQRTIGLILTVAVIIGTPYSIMTEVTRQPLIDWGKSILKTNDPLHTWGEQIRLGQYTNIYLAIAYVIIVFGKILSPVFFLKITVNFAIDKLGFPNEFPSNWAKYLNFYCKNCQGTFQTRNQFNAHKKICIVKPSLGTEKQ